MAEPLTGQITILVPGTAQQGPSAPLGRDFKLVAHPGNTGYVFVGNDGSDDVTSANGVALSAGEQLEIRSPGGYDNGLAAFWFDAANASDIVAWMKIR